MNHEVLYIAILIKILSYYITRPYDKPTCSNRQFVEIFNIRLWCTCFSCILFAWLPIKLVFFFIGKEAYNRERQGGWLITNLEAQIKETLDQKPKKVDLLAELTKVSGRIAFNYETETGSLMDSGHKSVPCLYHRLSKDIIIWPEEMEKTMQLLVEKEGSEWEKFSSWDP